MRVRKILDCLFENEGKQELVHAWYEDLDGYIIFEECNGSQKRDKMTTTQFYNEYTKVR